tara:strand:- start:205 stop:387 length:183 start_codon:yes stop_codon:yes gene_type:complete
LIGQVVICGAILVYTRVFSSVLLLKQNQQKLSTGTFCGCFLVFYVVAVGLPGVGWSIYYV